MSLDTTIKNRMVHTLSYATISSVSGSGEITYSSVSTTDAYIEEVDNISFAFNGEERLISHKIWTAINFTNKTIVWLPGDDTSDMNLSRNLARIKKYYDLQGNLNHTELWLGAV